MLTIIIITLMIKAAKALRNKAKKTSTFIGQS